MAAEPEGGVAAGEEGDAPAWSAVSELHLTLQEVLLELHRATAQAARPGKRPADEGDEASAEALLEASRRFERLIEALPSAVRCPDKARLERELEDLQRQDAEASEQAEQLSARAEALRAAVDARWREACQELCGGAVSVAHVEDCPSPHDEQAATASSSSSSSLPRVVGDPSAGRGVRPRLQDLTQERSRRFIEELEFVQCLANPEYVQWLATYHYFEDPAFVEFLGYLSYWRHPPHVYHVVYPQALRMLELLQNPAMRCRMHRLDARALLQSQVMWQWSHGREVTLDAGPCALASAAPAAAARTTSAVERQPVSSSSRREWDVLQDWTCLTGVIADKSWHEKVERINAPEFTVPHVAKMIGKMYLSKTYSDPAQLERAVQKYQHFWADQRGAGDLGKVMAAQHTEALLRGRDIPKEALDRLAPLLLPPPGEVAPQATPRKRGRRC
uniref:Mediator of RNA polymerase II transcription subunit 31 n=1 Tax=Alexandrium monilatum TaxID=311494 RepID=A0A7S4VD82_9DINO